MTEILPTVGRVIWFTPSRLTGDGRFAHIDGRKPLAAIVAHVFNDALVNLAVFDSNGQSTAELASRLCRKASRGWRTANSASGCRTRSGKPRGTQSPTKRKPSAFERAGSNRSQSGGSRRGRPSRAHH